MKQQTVITLFLFAVACGSPETQSTDSAQQTTNATTTEASSTAPASADYDLQFIDTMTKHHQMAVIMSETAQQKASDAKVKEFGRKGAEDQKKDIERLAAWRQQWHVNAADASSMHLPGAASMNMDMSHMQTSSGHDFDMMFVDMMIPHHRGAIEMARDALQKAQRQELKDFAQETIDKQEKEIAELEAWKKSMGMPSSTGASAGLPVIDPAAILAVGVQRVEPKKVCMINERVFTNDQIPVQVGGKTYYGCCEMCKTTLAQNESKRTAIDPVSKRRVDKALAVIGSDRQGRVYYFEDEANLRAFNPPA